MTESPQHLNKRGSKWPASKSSKKLTPLQDPPSAPLTNASASTTIHHKKELVEAVRRLNPAGTNVTPFIFWDVEGSLKTSTIDDSEVKQQLAIVENGVNYNARRYNDLRILNDRLTQELKKKLDELEDQKSAFERLDAMKKAETHEATRIDNLQRDIIKVESDIAHKSHYCRQLEHVLGRLKRNQLKFDAHMNGMEETLAALQKEGMEVKLLTKGLDAGLAKASAVLEQTQNHLTTARKSREVLITQRRAELGNSQLLQEWMLKREEVKVALALQLRGDLTRGEENFLRSQISEKVEKTKNLQRATEESHKKLQSMEDTFTKLKQVTGVSSLEEMHEKFSNQRNNKKNLEQEVKDAESRLVAAKKANHKQEKAFQDLKSSGGGVSEFTRESTDKLEDEIIVARNEYKITKAGSERLATVLLGLNQGSRGLLQRVGAFLHMADGGVFELTQGGEEPPWAETLEALSTAEQVLAKMLEILNGEGGASPSNIKSPFEAAAENDDNSSGDRSSNTFAEAPCFANNVRIKSRKILRDIEVNRTGDDDSVLLEKDKDRPGNFGNVVNTALAAMDLNLGTTTDEAGDTKTNPMTQSSPGYGNPNDDPAVPSRVTVKKISSRTTQEAKTKEKNNIRQKRLLERMNGTGKGGVDDTGIASAARLKAQAAMADRLSQGHIPATLPEGVTLRDDAMTKTTAFLSKLPHLV